MIEDLWYKNAIIYSLNIETFMDANGDGIGDFEGLARRLNYLQALGVDTIWLAPFQTTPNKDNGYDIKDYYGVEPRYGSSGDFVEFMHRANKLGIKVIIDLVVNHTSDEHAWFRLSRKHVIPYRDWYIWSKKKPSGINTGMVFPGVQESTWTYDKEARAYYFHRFYEFQPSLNMDNEEVRTEIQRIMGYWLQLGIAGFRLDAVPFVLESVQPDKKETELNFNYLSQMRHFLQWRRGDAVFLGEANVIPEDSEKYFAEGNGLHLMFNFFVNQHLFYTLATGDIRPLAEALLKTKDLPPTAQWAHFLRNHDELDLGRLSKGQRKKVYDRFGPEDHMLLYDRGIRRRLASMLGNRQQMELSYSLLFSLPGTPVIYYGDEIGMGDDLNQTERNSVRTPMQWADDHQAGFSQANKVVRPVINEGPYSYRHVNMESQRRDPDSLLNWLSSLIRLRKECPEIGWGRWEIVDTKNQSVLCMVYTWKGNSLLTLHNFEEKQYEIKLRLEQHQGSQLTDLHKNSESVENEEGVHAITIEAYGYRWFRLGDLTHLLHQDKQ